MKRPSLLALTVLGGFILACTCGGMGETDETTYDYDWEMSSVPVAEPWASLNLPTSDGLVLFSDSTGMMVSHEQPFDAINDRYTGAMNNSDWTKADDYSDVGFTAISYNKDGTQIGLVVTGDTSGTLVMLEDLGEVPESESSFANAKVSGKEGASKKAATKKATRTGAKGINRKATGKKGGKKKSSGSSSSGPKKLSGN